MQLSLSKLSSLALLLFALNSSAAETLADAANLQQLGAANPNDVIVLMISQDNCGFCVRVKEDYLKPLLASQQHPPLRVLHLGKNQQVVDFDGQTRQADSIANRLGGRFTPTLLFVDAKGEPVHEPIVGLTTPEYYGYYLDEAIADSRKRIN
ncbi:MAG: hypothetical protein HWE12_01445 [Oceanospirillaceae bacterium]|nr:hypothetical protein [Oceanospirillaceae bacterium]